MVAGAGHGIRQVGVPQSAHTAVGHHAQRVQVAPRPHVFGFGVVLLKRRIARRQNRGDALGPLPDRLPGRPKVQQHRAPVAAQHDVARLDVAVDVAGLVDLHQPAQHFADNALQMGGRQGGIFGQQEAEGLAVDILQHQIGRAVGLEKAIDFVQMRVVKAS